MQDKRRDHRVQTDLPFLISDPESPSRWHCHTVDISPTGMQLVVDEDEAPPVGTILSAVIQGPTEKGWEHINTRPVRVVRSEGKVAGLTYTELDPD